MFTHKIRLPRMVRSDMPVGPISLAPAGLHVGYANRYGAMSVIDCNGELLGVMPWEFEYADDEDSVDKSELILGDF
jgi:hypothetical protein